MTWPPFLTIALVAASCSEQSAEPTKAASPSGWRVVSESIQGEDGTLKTFPAAVVTSHKPITQRGEDVFITLGIYCTLIKDKPLAPYLKFSRQVALQSEGVLLRWEIGGKQGFGARAGNLLAGGTVALLVMNDNLTPDELMSLGVPTLKDTAAQMQQGDSLLVDVLLPWAGRRSNSIFEARQMSSRS
jgi:hypothetical protein